MQAVFHVELEFQTELFLTRRSFILPYSPDVISRLKNLHGIRVVKFTVDHVLSVEDVMGEIATEVEEQRKIAHGVVS